MGARYERLGETSPSPEQRQAQGRGGVSTSTAPAQPRRVTIEDEADSSDVENPDDFPSALGFAGLLVPDIQHAPRAHTSSSTSNNYGPFDGVSPYGDGMDEHQPAYFPPDSDRMPLTDPSYLQPMSSAATSSRQRQDGSKNPSVTFETSGYTSGYRMGGHSEDPEAGLRARGIYGNTLAPDGAQNRSRSPSTAGVLYTAGSIVRAMSQRVVNLSGEAAAIEASARRQARRESRKKAALDGAISTPDTPDSRASLGSLSDESESRYQPKHKKDPLAAGPNYQQNLPTAPVEKALRFFGGAQPQQSFEQELQKPPNPLRGKTLGIFSPESKIRNKLADVLVYPLTEPAILILIVVQTVLLAVESSKSVYTHPRPMKWGQSPIDYALFGLFVVFTLELVARIIVSGFFMNAPEYSTRKNKSGFKATLIDKYQTVFKPQRTSSTKPSRNPALGGQTIVRSFTAIQGESIRTVEQAQRLQLARRAFLRHSFNRLDLMAVVAYWISFFMGISGYEGSSHLYVFRMLSCLRILRLLALTHGTAVSKRILSVNHAHSI